MQKALQGLFTVSCDKQTTKAKDESKHESNALPRMETVLHNYRNTEVCPLSSWALGSFR